MAASGSGPSSSTGRRLKPFFKSADRSHPPSRRDWRRRVQRARRHARGRTPPPGREGAEHHARRQWPRRPRGLWDGARCGAAVRRCRARWHAAYMAPEFSTVASRRSRADIYAVAVLLYRLLTGGYPVDGDSTNAIKAAHAERRRVSLLNSGVDVPAALASAIQRGLSPNPEDRFRPFISLPERCDFLGIASSAG